MGSSFDVVRVHSIVEAEFLVLPMKPSEAGPEPEPPHRALKPVEPQEPDPKP